jgi:hypothetical protein
MVKAYLRYEHAGAFGVISSGCNVLYDASGRQLYTGALENIAAWNIRQGSQVGISQQQTKLQPVQGLLQHAPRTNCVVGEHLLSLSECQQSSAVAAAAATAATCLA